MNNDSMMTETVTETVTETETAATPMAQRHAAAIAASAAQQMRVSGLAGQLAELEARHTAAQTRLAAAERAGVRAQAALQSAQAEHRAAQARALIAQDDQPDLSVTSAAIASAEAALSEAHGSAAAVADSVKAEVEAIAKERAELQRQHVDATALHAELERQTAEAHTLLGVERLEGIGAAYVAAASAFAEAYARLGVARSALSALETQREETLRAWPALRDRAESYAPFEALHTFDMLQSMANWLSAHYAGAGVSAPVPTTVEGHPARIPLRNIVGRIELLQRPLNIALDTAGPHARHLAAELEHRRRELERYIADAATATRPAALDAGDAVRDGVRDAG